MNDVENLCKKVEYLNELFYSKDIIIPNLIKYKGRKTKTLEYLRKYYKQNKIYMWECNKCKYITRFEKYGDEYIHAWDIDYCRICGSKQNCKVNSFKVKQKWLKYDKHNKRINSIITKWKKSLMVSTLNNTCKKQKKMDDYARKNYLKSRSQSLHHLRQISLDSVSSVQSNHDSNTKDSVSNKNSHFHHTATYVGSINVDFITLHKIQLNEVSQCVAVKRIIFILKKYNLHKQHKCVYYINIFCVSQYIMYIYIKSGY